MAGKNKKNNKKQAAPVAEAPVVHEEVADAHQEVADVTDTASDASSVEGAAEPSAEAPVEEPVAQEAPVEQPVVEEAAAEPVAEEAAPVADVAVEEPVATPPVAAVEAEAPKSRGLSLEERVMTDTTPRSPRHDVLALPDTTKMWFLHPSFYYQKTKDVYSYTTSFRGVAPLAAVGETSVNYLLKQLNLKQVATLGDVDSNLAPALATIDEQLDERVAGVLQTLVDGQDYLLAKKDQVVGRAKEVQTATLDKVTESVTTVTTALDKTRDSVTTATSSALDTVAKAKAATLETVTSTAHLVLSYVPLLNKKVMA